MKKIIGHPRVALGHMSLLILGSVLFTPTALAINLPQSGMRPGLWETTLEMETPKGNMKLPTGPARCISSKDVEQGHTFGQQTALADPKAKCEISNLKNSGSHIQYSLTCDLSQTSGAMKQKQFSADYDFTTTANESRGTIKIKGQDGGPLIQHLYSKRLGDC